MSQPCHLYTLLTHSVHGLHCHPHHQIPGLSGTPYPQTPQRCQRLRADINQAPSSLSALPPYPSAHRRSLPLYVSLGLFLLSFWNLMRQNTAMDRNSTPRSTPITAPATRPWEGSRDTQNPQSCRLSWAPPQTIPCSLCHPGLPAWPVPCIPTGHREAQFTGCAAHLVGGHTAVGARGSPGEVAENELTRHLIWRVERKVPALIPPTASACYDESMVHFIAITILSGRD